MFAAASKSASRLLATRLHLPLDLKSSSRNSASLWRLVSHRSPPVGRPRPSRRRLDPAVGPRRPATRSSGPRRRRRRRGPGHRSAARCFSGTPDGPRGRSVSTRARRPLQASRSRRRSTPATGATTRPCTAQI